MAVKTSYNADTKKYSVASSKNKTLNNISNVIRTTTTGGTYTTTNASSNRTVSTTTKSTSSTKSNGNKVADNYSDRSVNDRYQKQQLYNTRQSTLADQKIAESQAKYAGIYTDAEKTYIEKISDSNEIIGRNYQSSVALPEEVQPLNITSNFRSSGILSNNVSYGQTTSSTHVGMKTGDMDDGDYSNNIARNATKRIVSPLNQIKGSQGRYMNLKKSTGFSDSMDTSNYFKAIFHANGLWDPKDINLYKNYYRFGALNPTFALDNCREFLFFTKPDLNIYTRDDSTGKPGSLNSYLASQPFWTELVDRYSDLIPLLQKSMGNNENPFNFLLSNMVQSNLEMPNISAESIDTPANMYGVNYDYRGSSEASDDSYQFSLEFKDNKYLPVYHFFKAYDDYQSIKHHGYIQPWVKYIANKILYDHFAIFKIMVDDDMETIIYYAKLYGVKPMSVPREAFSNTDFSNGLSYNIDFKAAFVRDMRPYIISDFNTIAKPYYDTLKYNIDIHNVTLDRPDNRPAMGAYIEKVPYSATYNGKNKGAVSAKYAPGGFVYKLRWKGNAKL